MSVSSGLTNNRGIWTKKYSDGANLYFSTFVEYGSISNGKGLNPSTVKTYLLYRRNRGLVTEWVTAGILGVDGKFKPLKNSEGFRVEDGKLVELGSGGLYDYPANDYILGDLARRDLVSDGKDSLRYQTINNAKYLLRIDSGGTPSDIDQAFRTSHNITPPGQQPENVLLGPSLGADQAVPTPSGGQQPPPTLPVTGIPEEKYLVEATNYQMAPKSGLRYPEKITKEQDRISFTAKTLVSRTLPTTPKGEYKLDFDLSRVEPLPANSEEGPVVIAIQAPISDQNSVEWGGDNVNPIDAAIFGLSMNLIDSEKPEDVANTIQGLTQSLYATAKGTSSRIKQYLAGQAANINNVLARTENVILNPNMELLFNGPQLRPFTFTFKMSARSQSEAKIIKQIINYFKYHMAVRKENNKLFLRAPHVFGIQYLYGESTLHPGINKIKNCALTNFSVDYTPLGSYATYRDGTMVAYTLNMQFQELTPIYDTDYESYKIDSDPKKPVSIGP